MATLQFSTSITISAASAPDRNTGTRYHHTIDHHNHRISSSSLSSHPINIGRCRRAQISISLFHSKASFFGGTGTGTTYAAVVRMEKKILVRAKRLLVNFLGGPEDHFFFFGNTGTCLGGASGRRWEEVTTARRNGYSCAHLV